MFVFFELAIKKTLLNKQERMLHDPNFSRLNSSQYQQSPPSSKLSKSNRVSSERSTSQSSPSSEQSSSRQKSLPLSIYCMRKI